MAFITVHVLGKNISWQWLFNLHTVHQLQQAFSTAWNG